MKFYTYAVPAIDLGWEHLKTVQQALVSIVDCPNIFAESSLKIDLTEVNSFSAQWETAKKEAAQAGWEGDFRHDPYVFWLPGDGELVLGFVFKQDNGGTTFVMSPVPLPWLQS